MLKTYISQLLHQITDFRYRVTVFYHSYWWWYHLSHSNMCSLHYGFVWISEPMAGTLFVQLCLKTVLSAHYQAFVWYLFWSKKEHVCVSLLPWLCRPPWWINFMFCLTLVQGLGRRVPPVANAHLNYCFLPYGTVKTRSRWISHRPHTNRPRTDIWWATGYLVPDSDK